jgi:predicted ATP-grasp superfamily ATP-dependent carboligase
MKDSYQNFQNDLLRLSAHYEKEKLVYLPVEDDTTTLFYEYLKENRENPFLYLLPSFDSFSLAQNKKRLNDFCLTNNIPAPQRFEKKRIIEWHESDFKKLVAKPIHSKGATGLYFIEQFSDISKISNLSDDEYVFQEKIENSAEVVGAFFFFNRGKMVSSFCHQRIRTYPPDGGVTVYSRFCRNPVTETIGRELLEKLQWSGFAMVEFLYDIPSSTYKVIEVNPRLWGSVLLSEFAGFHFIENYINCIAGKPIIPVSERNNIFIRWFFPFDIILYLRNKGCIPNFWRFDLKNTCYIGWTYSSWYRSLVFIMVTFFRFSNIKKFFNKILRLK